jgi:hypothetical protein
VRGVAPSSAARAPMSFSGEHQISCGLRELNVNTKPLHHTTTSIPHPIPQSPFKPFIIIERN